jgi:hypothetical protein
MDALNFNWEQQEQRWINGWMDGLMGGWEFNYSYIIY